ncbi:MAG: hypothetical protein R3F60_08095 [bacterium]
MTEKTETPPGEFAAFEDLVDALLAPENAPRRVRRRREPLPPVPERGEGQARKRRKRRRSGGQDGVDRGSVPGPGAPSEES